MTLEGWQGWAAVSAPLIALGVVIALSMRLLRSRPPAAGVGAPAAPPADVPVAEPSAGPVSVSSGLDRADAVALPATPRKAAAPPASAPEAETPEAAEGLSDELPASPVRAARHLADGVRLMAAERFADAAKAFQAACRSASLSEAKEIHAAARIELGDIARVHGDLTTACEHWQIARTLFAEAGRPKDEAAADERMIRHGCPTDWVLNDF